MNRSILSVQDVKLHFNTEEGRIKALEGVSFDIEKGATLGIVGESGCGKSVTSLAIMNLIPPRGVISNGSITWHPENGHEVDITKFKEKDKRMCAIRGKEISMIFQEPMTALTPVYRIGKQITEKILLHENVDKVEAKEKALELLDWVGMPDPSLRFHEYPFELSGGLRQRVLIAMALACNPQMLIADEPTTALDVTIQAQVLRLIRRLQEEFNMTIAFITHDLGVIAELVDMVVIMYLGKIVERGTVRQIFNDPRHPYTKGLLQSLPRVGNRAKLFTIFGSVPSGLNYPTGCGFFARCPKAFEKCKVEPAEYCVDEKHLVKCHLYSEG